MGPRRAEADRLLTLIDDLDQGWLLARAHLSAVYVAAGRGQWRRGAEHAQAAAAQAGSAPGPMAIDLADARPAIASAQGDHAQVVAMAGPVLAGLGSLADLEPTRLSFWPGYAHALAQSGRLEEADRTLQLFEDLAGPIPPILDGGRRPGKRLPGGPARTARIRTRRV